MPHAHCSPPWTVVLSEFAKSVGGFCFWNCIYRGTIRQIKVTFSSHQDCKWAFWHFASYHFATPAGLHVTPKCEPEGNRRSIWVFTQGWYHTIRSEGCACLLFCLLWSFCNRRLLLLFAVHVCFFRTWWQDGRGDSEMDWKGSALQR